ncbi:hypothetical protein EZV62_022330 [Acer yangbiense]|uniref:ATP-dependent DNA helicase n=1 Tax=Acer yangbiense TaxID=1000413 RepID=A0A5C7H876_9ROSI|nr:hypothetical protein EZV62_022330 [Acer yangbiense]
MATPDSAVELPLTAKNVENVIDEVRPYLIADGGNVALHEIDGNIVWLKLQGVGSRVSKFWIVSSSNSSISYLCNSTVNAISFYGNLKQSWKRALYHFAESRMIFKGDRCVISRTGLVALVQASVALTELERTVAPSGVDNERKTVKAKVRIDGLGRMVAVATIPDEKEDPTLFAAIETYMMHGPCGQANLNSPCMKGGKCSKRFPKKFTTRTKIDEEGFPHYRRRDNGRTVKKKNIELDNRYVVPYNPKLLLKYQAHINVEFTCQTSAIKYLLKYIHKGNDQVTIAFSHSAPDGDKSLTTDEIQKYYDYRYPPVQRLSFHLPQEKTVIFKDSDSIEDVLKKADAKKSMFEAWMGANKKYEEARNLIYSEFPTNDKDIKNNALAEVEKSLHGNGRSLRDYATMPFSFGVLLSEVHNKLILDELSYDRALLIELHKKYLSCLTVEHNFFFYDEIMSTASENKEGFFFLNGFGRTGKTFIWKALSVAFRSKGEIVFNVASSGITSLLLPGGRTSHSRLSLPIQINEDSTCNIKQGSPQAELLLKTKLIIWDEAPMVHRFCFEALDRTLKDILKFSNPNSCEEPFGGKIVVLRGDFRQILPVVPHGGDERTYLSSDTICKEDANFENEEDTFSPDILNTFTASGLPIIS